MSRVPPVARLAALLMFVVATFINSRLSPLPVVLLVLMILLAIEGFLPRFLKFLVFAQLPMTIMLIAVWGWVAKAPPGKPMGSDPHGGMLFALLVSFRLAVVGGAFLLFMLSIPYRVLPATLRGWGFRGEGMVVALGVFAVEPELKLRAEQILTARRARGLLKGGRWAGLKQLPRLLRPLFVWSIRSAVHRAEVWEQRAVLLRVHLLPTEEVLFSSAAGVAAMAFSVLWLSAAIAFRWPGLVGIR
jgi:energy-coupling factor transporter transmembrane protein EcfT